MAGSPHLLVKLDVAVGIYHSIAIEVTKNRE